MDWLINNWDNIFAVIGAVITACSLIVASLGAFFPAEEGTLYAKIISILDKLSVFYAKYKK